MPGIAQRGEHAPGVDQEIFPGGGQGQRAPGAVEQRQPDLIFDFLDLHRHRRRGQVQRLGSTHRHRRRGQVQRLGSTADAAVAGDFDKYAELAEGEVHGHSAAYPKPDKGLMMRPVH